jgi:hypothetical protein
MLYGTNFTYAYEGIHYADAWGIDCSVAPADHRPVFPVCSPFAGNT